MINGIAVSKLRNSEFSQFISDALSLIQQNNPAKLNIKAEFDALKASHDQLVALLNPELGNSLTAQLEEADAKRDQAITGIVALVSAFTYHFDPTVNSQASKLNATIEKFGSGIARESYQSQTAIINSLLSDIRSSTDLVKAANSLQLSAWIEHLDTANQAFNTLYLQRVTNMSDNPVESVKDKRQTMSTEYYALRDMLTAYYTIKKGAEPFAATVGQLNELINQYNTLLTNRKSAVGEESME